MIEVIGQMLDWFRENRLSTKHIEFTITFPSAKERQAFRNRLSCSEETSFDKRDERLVFTIYDIPIHLRVKPRCPTCGKLS